MNEVPDPAEHLYSVLCIQSEVKRLLARSSAREMGRLYVTESQSLRFDDT